MDKVLAILVTYNPNVERVKHTINILQKSCVDTLVADNSNENNANMYPALQNVVYHYMGGNKGIAAAQSFGMQYAINNDYTLILHLDQDSNISNDIIENLLSDYKTLSQYDDRTIGIGPRAFNRDSGVYINEEFYGAEIKINDKLFYPTKMLMSSGSLVSVSKMKDVGLMLNELFIDNVDWEWSWRACVKYGYHCYISKQCLLEHQLGEGDKTFLGKNMHISSPFRVYFLFRNYIYLLKFSYVPTEWKMQEFRKLVLKLIYYPLFASPRLVYTKKITKGIIDGVRMLSHSNTV